MCSRRPARRRCAALSTMHAAAATTAGSVPTLQRRLGSAHRLRRPQRCNDVVQTALLICKVHNV